MFTGIVSDVGRVRRVEKRGDTHIAIGTRFNPGDIEIGASVSCSGICMTVVDKGIASDRWFAVTASAETLSKTTAGEWNEGREINLERPLRVGDELGGHIVTGHVDGTAVIVATAAAMGTAWNQNDPVTKMREAASLKGADPRTAAIG